MSNYFVQEKEPDEIIPSSIDFRKRIPSGEAIDVSTSVIKVYDENGGDKTTDMLVAKAVTGTILSGILQAGTKGSGYDVDFTAMTSPTGYKFKGHVALRVI